MPVVLLDVEASHVHRNNSVFEALLGQVQDRFIEVVEDVAFGPVRQLLNTHEILIPWLLMNRLVEVFRLGLGSIMLIQRIVQVQCALRHTDGPAVGEFLLNDDYLNLYPD
jgi:hypothetical protein